MQTPGQHPVDNPMQTLPLNTFQEIPTPRADAQTITALIKEKGRVTGYQLSGGQKLEKQAAIDLCRQGGIKGVGIATRRGNPYLKSLPDGAEGNNLGHLPAVKP